ncbi:glycine cleavage system protein GcvH [Hwanghaeella grinnelliae]|jgi:glycine cleavage system H protein|uniref:Glycine cleavage system H protein n=1 Tax=Hwanghaeella grinnelliae TaxID=2500179 RepID=A0A3S2Z7G0_9PROT|nr:glycine cleavage system protein GcvH [Hwanghaeella grinnelliae]RVU35045.1 glycine cleavage system protein GcvH [Hwanghaeella grinnelliae]
MSDMKFSEEHEWVSVDGDIATIGITNFAQEQLGDVVFVDLPEVGGQVSQGGDAGVVESVKAASEVYTPLSGEIVEVNEDLESAPDLVNTDPEGDGWFFKLRMDDTAELDDLMDAAAYKKFCDEHG